MGTHLESSGRKKKKSWAEEAFESVEDIGTRLRKSAMPDALQSDAVKTIDKMDEKRGRRKNEK